MLVDDYDLVAGGPANPIMPLLEYLAQARDIGLHFGGRNHSTVVAAEKKVRQWLQDNVELALGERRVRARELVERVELDLLR